ncbi:unnamed protein product [Vitrella brassicaformis CCMP3155]|uniref:Uncharacterized protein n=2 Tax=Vitrella brassicaformis TaxID=1169539 RepID=A0A0G4H301_VITBC|nr:unnamed protein product [Vitrella brassicaformis CCMP3155]|eukprot:CEM37810.1 unnamed protein product [Vitrella brassicaformis CCMP3155]
MVPSAPSSLDFSQLVKLLIHFQGRSTISEAAVPHEVLERVLTHLQTSHTGGFVLHHVAKAGCRDSSFWARAAAALTDGVVRQYDGKAVAMTCNAFARARRAEGDVMRRLERQMVTLIEDSHSLQRGHCGVSAQDLAMTVNAWAQLNYFPLQPSLSPLCRAARARATGPLGDFDGKTIALLLNGWGKMDARPSCDDCRHASCLSALVAHFAGSVSSTDLNSQDVALLMGSVGQAMEQCDESRAAVLKEMGVDLLGRAMELLNGGRFRNNHELVAFYNAATRWWLSLPAKGDVRASLEQLTASLMQRLTPSLSSLPSASVIILANAMTRVLSDEGCYGSPAHTQSAYPFLDLLCRDLANRDTRALAGLSAQDLANVSHVLGVLMEREGGHHEHEHEGASQLLGRLVAFLSSRPVAQGSIIHQCDVRHLCCIVNGLAKCSGRLDGSIRGVVERLAARTMMLPHDKWTLPEASLTASGMWVLQAIAFASEPALVGYPLWSFIIDRLLSPHLAALTRLPSLSPAQLQTLASVAALLSNVHGRVVMEEEAGTSPGRWGVMVNGCVGLLVDVLAGRVWEKGINGKTYATLFCSLVKLPVVRAGGPSSHGPSNGVMLLERLLQTRDEASSVALTLMPSLSAGETDDVLWALRQPAVAKTASLQRSRWRIFDLITQRLSISPPDRHQRASLPLLCLESADRWALLGVFTGCAEMMGARQTQKGRREATAAALLDELVDRFYDHLSRHVADGDQKYCGQLMYTLRLIDEGSPDADYDDTRTAVGYRLLVQLAQQARARMHQLMADSQQSSERAEVLADPSGYVHGTQQHDAGAGVRVSANVAN